MGKGKGNDYQLWIESSTAGTYNLVKGQQSFKIGRSQASTDTTTKDEGSWGTGLPMRRNWTVTGSVIPNLPDAGGYTRLETLANSQTLVNIQLRKGGTAGASGDVVFAGAAWANLDSTDFDQDSSVGVSVNLTGQGAPTTDVLTV